MNSKCCALPLITSRKERWVVVGITGSGSSRRNNLMSAAAEGTSPMDSRGASPNVSKEFFNFSTNLTLPDTRNRPSKVRPELDSIKLHNLEIMKGIPGCFPILVLIERGCVEEVIGGEGERDEVSNDTFGDNEDII